MLTRLLCLSVTATVLTTRPIASQVLIDITGEPACIGCKIHLEPVATLGDAYGPGIIEGDYARVIRDSRGRYYVTTQYPATIKVFDANGDFLQVIGRRGSGPGEFLGIGFVLVGKGDTLHVFDDTQRRWTVLSPNYEYVRSSRLGLAVEYGGVLLDDGRVVIPSRVRTPERVGLPLHLLDRHGKFIRSFGAVPGKYRADIPGIHERSIARASMGGVWSSYSNQYLIERWDLEGREQRGLRRTADWFPPRLSPYRAGQERGIRRPEPILSDIQEDERGRLWIIISVAGTNWRRGVAAGGPHGMRVVDGDLLYDSRIEVIDPSNGNLLASQTLPQPHLNFVGPGLVGTVLLDSAAIPHVGIWRVVLQPRS